MTGRLFGIWRLQSVIMTRSDAVQARRHRSIALCTGTCWDTVLLVKSKQQRKKKNFCFVAIAKNTIIQGLHFEIVRV